MIIIGIGFALLCGGLIANSALFVDVGIIALIIGAALIVFDAVRRDRGTARRFR